MSLKLELPQWVRWERYTALPGPYPRPLINLNRKTFISFLTFIFLALFITIHSPSRHIITDLLPTPTNQRLLGQELPGEYAPLLGGRRYLPDSLHLDQHADLGRRLAAFLRRPVLPFEDVVEANERQCPPHQADHLDFFSSYQQNDPEWRGISLESIYEMRAKIVTFLDDLHRHGWPLVARERKRGWFGHTSGLPDKVGRFGYGRGIVMTAGNGDSVIRLMTQLRHLRRLGCLLPVEIFHFSHEIQDGKEQAEIQALGGELRELETSGGLPAQGWMIKPLAIIQSSFREVLFLDPDSIPLRDPSHLFDTNVYKRYGSVFWADLWKFSPYTSLWRILGQTCTFKTWSLETGQLLFDKTGQNGLNLAALWISVAMLNDHTHWGKYLYGDKDTFRFAFEILKVEYGHAPKVPGLGGFIEEDTHQFCGSAQLQPDLILPSGRTEIPPLFVHYNILKLQPIKHDFRWFTHLSRMRINVWNEPSLNDGHSQILVHPPPHNINCLNVVWHPEESPPDGQWLEIIDFEDLEEKALSHFDEDFQAEGGYANRPAD